MGEIFSSGRRLFYDEQGEGPPLVLLSGLGGDHRAFGVTSRHFALDYRVLALDSRDSGRSDRATEPYTTADLADDVAGWIDAVDAGPARVVGHSLGGLIAQELAIRHPTKVHALVLCSTHAGANPWRKALIESWIIARRELAPPDFARVTLPWLAAPPFYLVKAQVDGMIRFAERNEWPQSPDAFERQARAASDHDARPLLGSIRAPTLVLSGELDLVNPPPIARELADGLANSRLILLPGVGHLPHLEDGPKFRREIGRFLDEVG